MTFTRGFHRYACVGDEISCDVGEFQITARLMQDSCSHIDDDDFHNLEHVEGNQRDKVVAARQAWKDDEWWYCGVVLSVSKNGVVLDDRAAALWAIEVNYPGSDNSYLTVVANDLIGEATEAGERSVGASMRDWEEYNKSLSNRSKAAQSHARLVALAPELLAILEQLVDFWVHDTPVRNGSLDTIKARILVDMAHGRTPDADLVEELEGYGSYFTPNRNWMF